ncbi:hypothetical protein [Trichocoleus sp. FACHB-591]|nr:hypothetical protein [Trichocoleus sp. FACHB-591]
MHLQNDVFFRDAHINEFLPNIDANGILLELDFVVFDVEEEDGVINAV